MLPDRESTDYANDAAHLPIASVLADNGGAPAAATQEEAAVGYKLTQSGVVLNIRPATKHDESVVIRLFSHVNAEDLRSRFGGTLQHVGATEAAPLLGDGSTSRTLLAFTDDGTIVAAATLADLPGTKTAEVALSVDAHWKGRGIAWTLLEHTLAYATAHGLTEVTSFEGGNERAAINLEREMGFVARLISASPVELSLKKNVAP